MFPETYHRVCSWNLFQNVLKHLGHAFKNSIQFGAEFSRCMYHFEYEDDLMIVEGSFVEE